MPTTIKTTEQIKAELKTKNLISPKAIRPNCENKPDTSLSIPTLTRANSRQGYCFLNAEDFALDTQEEKEALSTTPPEAHLTLRNDSSFKN